MNYVLILVGFCVLVAISIGSYYLGRYHSELIDKIRTLEIQKDEVPQEPEKPTVTGGAYQPPKEYIAQSAKEHKAGLVETKTPERLEWENKNELAKMEHGA